MSDHLPEMRYTPTPADTAAWQQADQNGAVTRRAMRHYTRTASEGDYSQPNIGGCFVALVVLVGTIALIIGNLP